MFLIRYLIVLGMVTRNSITSLIKKLNKRVTHHSNEPVYEAVLLLAKAVDSKDALDVVRGVPRRVQDDDAVGRRHVQAQAAGAGRN